MPFERTSPLTFWTIAGAVAIGTLTAHAIEAVAIGTWARIEVQRAAIELQKQAEASRRQAAERSRQIEEQALAAERARQAEQQLREAQQRAAVEAEQRKEDAWKRYYTPPEVCSNPPNNRVFMECANEHMRKKTMFEATYKP